MAGVLYLGDELSAAGYRLAGARVRSPQPGEATQALASALAHADADVVLLSAALAASVAPPALSQAACALRPLLLVVPDLVGNAPLPDLATRLRGQLGLDA